MLGKLRESRRSDDPDPYRGAQHDVAIRVTGLLWMVGAAAMAARELASRVGGDDKGNDTGDEG